MRFEVYNEKKKDSSNKFQSDCYNTAGGGICSASSFQHYSRRFIESAYFPDFQNLATNVLTDLKIAAGLRFEKYLSYLRNTRSGGGGGGHTLPTLPSCFA